MSTKFQLETSSDYLTSRVGLIVVGQLLAATPTLRQRFDQAASHGTWQKILLEESADLLKRVKARSRQRGGLSLPNVSLCCILAHLRTTSCGSSDKLP